MEGFVGGGCIAEGKGYDEILVEFWTLWCNKWRWRRKKMMVGSYSSCSFSEDKGEVSGD